jgi:hypothetical protein
MKEEIGSSFPVTVKMESKILGKTVDVRLWPDRAKVEGVSYTINELKTLISKGYSAANIRNNHEARKRSEP